MISHGSGALVAYHQPEGMNHAGQTAQQGQHYVDEEMEAEAYLDKGADRGRKMASRILSRLFIGIPRVNSAWGWPNHKHPRPQLQTRQGIRSPPFRQALRS